MDDLRSIAFLCTETVMQSEHECEAVRHVILMTRLVANYDRYTLKNAGLF